jgi:hypothetical protein
MIPIQTFSRNGVAESTPRIKADVSVRRRDDGKKSVPPVVAETLIARRLTDRAGARGDAWLKLGVKMYLVGASTIVRPNPEQLRPRCKELRRCS